MSAIVGILNKQAIALAADSAVTIDGVNKTKIFNRANKIFTLSKHHPVGIMVYNAADFMSTPWETIIKLYRKQLKEDSFNTLQEYQDDFIKFLKTKHCFTDELTQKRFLHRFAFGVINNIGNNVVRNNPALMFSKTPENVTAITNLIIRQIESETQVITDMNMICEDFLDYSYEDFKAFSAEAINAVIQQIFTTNELTLNAQQLESVYRLIHIYLRSKEEYTNFTGLVFVGFGEEEIYPRLLPIFVSLSVQDRLRYYVNDGGTAIISNENSGAVAPFAQHDVMDTILKGVDDNLHGAYLRNFETSLDSQKEAIAQSIEQINPALAIEIRSLDNQRFIDEYSQNNADAMMDGYIEPMLNAVSLLSKEDLAEMAESLIYLTYLKRRITFAEESVGGAVDVAIISKGDGFVWIKRKLYFDSKLNEHFIDNYLNS